MQYERETDRAPDEPLGEPRPVDALPGHLPGEWKPWPPPRAQDKDISVRRSDDRREADFQGFRAYRDGRMWRYEGTGELVVTGTGAEYLWREAEDEDETPPSAYQAAKDRSFAALSELSRLARALPEDGKETRAEAVVAGLIAHQLSQALTAAQTALDLARDPAFSDED